jgi:hypothetical protein
MAAKDAETVVRTMDLADYLLNQVGMLSWMGRSQLDSIVGHVSSSIQSLSASGLAVGREEASHRRRGKAP